MGRELFTSAAPIIVDGLFLPYIILQTVIADSFAGERERHTLETLLASRLSDRAILFGKVNAAVAYGSAAGIIGALAQAVVANLSPKNADSGLAFYPVGSIVAIVVLALLMSLLTASVGCLVSLRAATTRQAQLSLTFGFLVLVFAPFLGLWAREPLLLVGALPDLAVNLLSSDDKQTTVFYQYTAGIIPFVVAASILGAARLRSTRRVRTVLFAVAVCLAVISPTISTAAIVHSRSASDVTAMRRAIRLIPPNASVSAAQSLGGNVSTRRVVAIFPSVARVDWVIIGPLTSIDDRQQFRRRVAELRLSPRWTTEFDRSGIQVFRRRR
jgi:ABC-2 type transport system permease protein